MLAIAAREPAVGQRVGFDAFRPAELRLDFFQDPPLPVGAVDQVGHYRLAPARFLPDPGAVNTRAALFLRPRALALTLTRSVTLALSRRVTSALTRRATFTLSQPTRHGRFALGDLGHGVLEHLQFVQRLLQGIEIRGQIGQPCQGARGVTLAQ